MVSPKRDPLRELADKWERESHGLNREAELKSADWTNTERRLLDMHARIKRVCADELRQELAKVRRG
jgi:hypothetical protein